MSNIIDIISDYFPANGDIDVPLRSTVTISFSREMDTDRLEEDFLLEGPDTDQTLGPGLQTLGGHFVEGFLESPGMQGIVDGSFSFVTVSGVSTQMVFTPTWPLAALTEYVAQIRDTLDIGGETASGYLTFSFTTGSGSIEELPSAYSTSVLSSSFSEVAQVSTSGYAAPLNVIKSIPADHSVENSIETSEIIIEFNKALDPNGVTANDITVETIAASDHPRLSPTVAGDLAKSVTVEGNRLKINI